VACVLQFEVLSHAGISVAALLSKRKETMSTFKIVLVDTLGEELFSGSSVLSTHPPPPPVEEVFGVEEKEEDEEPIPPTLRSSVFVRVHDFGSGEYRRSDASFHVSEAQISEVMPCANPVDVDVEVEVDPDATTVRVNEDDEAQEEEEEEEEEEEDNRAA
jgi:hypothetical protein